jgi:hypothetical protein
MGAGPMHTNTEIRVIHGENVTAVASDKQVTGGIHSAMLDGLPVTGPPKKRRAFVILEHNHAHVGYTTTQNGANRFIFDIGEDADRAQAKIIAYLKKRNKGPLECLDRADRDERIRSVLAPSKQPAATTKQAVSYAAVVRGHRRQASRKNSVLSGASSRASSRSRSRSRDKGKRTRNHRGKLTCFLWDGSEGSCSYGKKCHFEHLKKPKAKPKVGAKKSGWQVVGRKGRKAPDRRPQRCPVLKVHSKANLHPGRWRNKMKQMDPETHKLTSWVSREGSWFTLHAEPEDAEELLEKLKPLRKLGLTVEEACEDDLSEDDNDEDSEADEPSVCAAYMSGHKCKHKGPRCS